jgi:hypothetical protein
MPRASPRSAWLEVAFRVRAIVEVAFRVRFRIGFGEQVAYGGGNEAWGSSTRSSDTHFRPQIIHGSEHGGSNAQLLPVGRPCTPDTACAVPFEHLDETRKINDSELRTQSSDWGAEHLDGVGTGRGGGPDRPWTLLLCTRGPRSTLDDVHGPDPRHSHATHPTHVSADPGTHSDDNPNPPTPAPDARR